MEVQHSPITRTLVYLSCIVVRRYIVEESSSIDDAEPVLHSTMTGTPASSLHTSSGEIMDSTMDSTGQLSSTQGPGLHMRDVALDSDLDRAVDSSALSGNMGNIFKILPKLT